MELETAIQHKPNMENHGQLYGGGHPGQGDQNMVDPNNANDQV